jgi:hypothetical protein
MSRRMTALLVAIVCGVVLVGPSTKARSGPTSQPVPVPRVGADPTANGASTGSNHQDLLPTVQKTRDEIRNLRRDVGELRKLLEPKLPSPANPAAQSSQIFTVTKTDFSDGDRKVMMLYLTPVATEKHRPLAEDPPSADEILQSVPDVAKSLLAGLVNTERQKIRIVVDKIVDTTGECRFYPLVGKARLKKCHYKCQVCFDKTVRSDSPVPFVNTQTTQAVVYIDHDYLIPCAGSAASPKTDQH